MNYTIRELESFSVINAGNIVMNTYIYSSTIGYIMVDTGYEHSLSFIGNQLPEIE